MSDVLISPNSFKECADSAEIAEFFAKYLPAAFHSEKERLTLTIKPISDGGDGFLSSIKPIYDVETLEYEISSPFKDSSNIKCPVGYCKRRKEVYIESAYVLGLKIIPKEKRKPLQLSSKGLGGLLKALSEDKKTGKLDFDKVIIGIGGTGTVDFAIGAYGVLGMELYDQNGNILEAFPENFNLIDKIKRKDVNFPFEMEVVIDVDNPLTGKNGAARVFGPQKGASEREVELLDIGIAHIVDLLKKDDPSIEEAFLSGAGGGLGGGLHYFFGAKYRRSDEFILDDLGIRNVKADFVITGEGSFDRQSMMNKGAGVIIKEFEKRDIPVFVCAGKIDFEGLGNLPESIKFIELSGYFSSPNESMRNIEKGIRKACLEIAKQYKEIKN